MAPPPDDVAEQHLTQQVNARPLVSFVVPTYEDAGLARRCVGALLRMEYEPIEVVVSDDSRSPQVLDAIAAAWGGEPRVRYFPGARTGVAGDNWNHGLDQARGEYVVLVHHDEIVTDPAFAADAVRALERTGKSAFVGGYGLEGIRTRSRFLLVRRISRLLRFPLWTLYLLNWIGPTAAVMFRASASVRFKPHIVWLADTEFYIRLLRDRDDMVANDHIYGVSVTHDGQITRSIPTTQIHRKDIAQLRAAKARFLGGVSGLLIAVLVTVLTRAKEAAGRGRGRKA